MTHSTRAADPVRSRAFAAVLLGTAVGDAIGLPREGLSPRRALRLFGPPPLRHRLVLGRGMTSDDTEHTCMTAQALLASGGDPDRFARSLAWRLRFWLLGLPAGTGLATAKSVLKLWLGFPPQRSGVWSAGNGPAMRAAILGVYAAADDSLLRKLVHASTVMTHRDPAAEQAALAVAIAAAYACGRGVAPDPSEFLHLLETRLDPSAPLLQLLRRTVHSVQSGTPFADYLSGELHLNRGVTGYINHTVPAALFCWLRWPADFRTAVEQVVVAGGDTDSTAAIVGALVAISAGPDAIPPEWLTGLAEWPRSVAWLRKLAAALDRDAASGHAEPLPLFWPALPLRNLVFLAIVLVHGLRRLFPPY